MKRGLRLLLLLGALALCVGGYFLVGKLVPAETPDDETAAATIAIPSLDSGALDRIDYARGGETVALKKSGDSWLYEADPSCPLDQTLVKQMVSVSTSLSASRSFESQDLAEYGLDQPSCSIALTDAGGGKKNFALGDRNEVTKEYYLTADGGNTVYLVDSALHDAFDKSLLDLVQKEAVPNMDGATRLSIERPDGTVTLSLAKAADGESAGAGSEDTSKTTSVWYLEQAGAAPATLDTAKVTDLLSELTQLVFRKCASYSAADADLAQYGLDAPAATVTVTYPAVSAEGSESGSGDAQTQTGGAAATFTLALGDVFGEDYRYARLADSQIIYLIDETTAQKLLSASWETLRPDA